jgi:hypothetical protein
MRYVLPEDPKQLLHQVAGDMFPGKSWVSRLAAACGVTRQAVNDWPPADTHLMDDHLTRAVTGEITRGSARLQLLHEILIALRDRRLKRSV